LKIAASNAIDETGVDAKKWILAEVATRDLQGIFHDTMVFRLAMVRLLS
jgi:hypothetical protein